MSYSVCAKCKTMVSYYEKYCGECVSRYPQLKQDKMFWKTFHGTPESIEEMVKEELRKP